jgi:predicted DNA-binding transcriptional regulator YafY
VAVSPQELAKAYSFQRTAPVRHDARLFRLLQDAIRSGLSLEVVYHSQSRGQTGRRTLDPYHLANVDGDWFLLAFCHLHKEVRVFRASRLRSCKPTGETFRVPEDFDPARFLETKFHAMAGDPPVEIRIRFDRAVAGYITERDWGPSHRIQFVTDGGVELGLTTENADAVLRWVLSWGTGAEVLSPAWARRRMRELLARVSERYGKTARRGTEKKR